MKKTFFLLITLFFLSMSSCGSKYSTSDDIEGTWKIYKIRNSSNSPYQEYVQNHTYTFEKASRYLGLVTIELDSNIQKLTGNYELEEKNNDITISLTDNNYTNSIRYQIESSTGIMKLKDYDSYGEILLMKQ